MLAGVSARKRSHSDMRSGGLPPTLVDEEQYRTTVLRLPASMTEDDLDDRISAEAHNFGLSPSQVTADIEAITSSLSGTTISSDPNNTNSIISQSTAPTSCSSSEYRPLTQSSIVSEPSPADLQSSLVNSEADKKRSSGLKRGIRKMTGFKKRRSLALGSSTLTSINSDSADTNQSDRASIKSGLKSPSSIKSSKSSWSSPLSATKSSYEHQSVDQEALKRSMESEELSGLRTTQLDERSRFLEFQNSLVTQLRRERDSVRNQKSEIFQQIIGKQEAKNYRAIEEFESRQLEEEMKMQREHDLEKRTAMMRLKHMEAYCQNPTPPPTPIDPSSGRPSMDSILPERKVTEKDYHNLAQQYRERDAMDNLHASKINVLRGKQKKAVENFAKKKEQEVSKSEREQQQELDMIDLDFAHQETNLRLALGVKKTRLEIRWRTQALIERSKLEKATGLKYAPLPDVLAAEDAKRHLMTA